MKITITRFKLGFVRINGISFCKRATKKAVDKGPIYGTFRLVKCAAGPIFIEPLRGVGWVRPPRGFVSISVLGIYGPLGSGSMLRRRCMFHQDFKRLYRSRIREKIGFKLVRVRVDDGNRR